MGAASHDSLEVGGRSIRVTHPDRVIYPALAATNTGVATVDVTKADVMAYYVGVAERILPHLRRRPVTRIRWPQGVTGQPFFEKQLPSHAPQWIERETIEHSDGDVTYPLAHEAATLVWFAQQNAIELHVPQWRFFGDSRRTDRLVIDLDPGPGLGLAECAEVAVWLREKLDADGLPSVPVTSGSKGIHIYARWRAAEMKSTPSEYAKSLAGTAERAMPSLVTGTMAKSERRGKLLLDWSQNNPAKTTVTPYSLRGRAQPFVATPRRWAELEDPGLSHITMTDLRERLAEADPLDVLR